MSIEELLSFHSLVFLLLGAAPLLIHNDKDNTMLAENIEWLHCCYRIVEVKAGGQIDRIDL